jgi:hypothetical protein
MRVAVVIISVGPNRPWFHLALTWMNVYCERFGFDLIVYRSPLLKQQRVEQFDCFQNFGRCQKLGIGQLFEEYDRVLQLDDTCMISPYTPNLARLVPAEMIGCYLEGKYREDDQFSSYLAAHKTAYGRSCVLPKDRFYNSGVTVYAKSHSRLFDLETVPWEAILGDCVFPTQGYLSHRAEELNYPLYELGIEFNCPGSVIKRLPSIEDSPAYLFHLTSALSPRERMEFALRIDRHFQRLVGEASR